MTTPVFISGRFRAGTTAVWQLFASDRANLALYEPLHPNLPAEIEHGSVSESHIGVQDYWQAWREHDDWRTLHRPAFAFSRLLLAADDEAPALEAYVSALLDMADYRRPVLQFNRMSLRLPWLQARFPHATILHISRDPRDSFVSSRAHLAEEVRFQANTDDAFELAQWRWSLAGQLPMLSREPFDDAYCCHYLLHRLDAQLAAQYADIRWSLEDNLWSNSEQTLAQMVEQGWLSPKAAQTASALLSARGSSKASDIADTSWFAERELQVDAMLNASGLNAWPKTALATITNADQPHWQAPAYQAGMDWSLSTQAANRAEIVRLLRQVRTLENADQ